MTVLLGPADADHFRIKVGRYNDRWYTDPLDGCTIADASDWQGPSATATKPPFANKYVPMRAIADMSDSEWRRLAALTADDRYEAIKVHEKQAGRINMDRGSIVHRWAEDRLFGRATIDQFLPGTPAALEQAERFRAALDAFFDTYQPELVACEVVCLHRTLNGVGYGGTSDAFVRIQGDVWCVDWKSRNSDHAAYGEEAGQGGAYIGAEYMIVRGPDGNPIRAHVPNVAGVLIVSIREDGFRAYPIDAAGAIAHYEAMHRWWYAQQQLTENKVIGRAWAPKNVAVPADPVEQQPAPAEAERREASDGSSFTGCPSAGALDRRAALLARYNAMSENEQQAFRDLHVDRNDLDAVETALNQVDRFNIEVEPQTPTLTVVPPPAPPPDEGSAVGEADVLELSIRYENLSAEAKAWTGALVAQGNQGHTWRIRNRPTVRRYEIYRGVLALAEWSNGGADDVVRAIVAEIVDSEGIEFPTIPPGLAIGLLDFKQAAQFALTASAVADDKFALVYDGDGGPPTLTPAA